MKQCYFKTTVTEPLKERAQGLPGPGESAAAQPRAQDCSSRQGHRSWEAPRHLFLPQSTEGQTRDMPALPKCQVHRDTQGVRLGMSRAVTMDSHSVSPAAEPPRDAGCLV